MVGEPTPFDPEVPRMCRRPWRAIGHRLRCRSAEEHRDDPDPGHAPMDWDVARNGQGNAFSQE